MRDSSADNPIPEHLRCSHLFVLMGLNPVPAWAAARLLLRQGGTLYLVHTRQPRFRAVAAEVAKRWLATGGRQPIYVPILPFDSREIVHTLTEQLNTISEGIVGFNYTGGTKVMAIHAYRALETGLDRGVGGPIFSYLDPEALTMRFDPSREIRDGAEPVFVGRAAAAELSVKDMFRLHETGARFEGMAPEPPALPVAQAIAALHTSADRVREWREFAMRLTRQGKGIAAQPIGEWPAPFEAVGAALLAGRSPTTTWHELARARVWPFQSAQAITAWLDGAWLESHVYQLVRGLRDSLELTDVQQDVRGAFNGYAIQMDVAITRGYQLLSISCYSGASTPNATQKLLEAVVRARQVGGDEAGAALVSMVPDAKAIENDVRIAAREERIRVLGLADFPRLEDSLRDWIKKGMPE